MPNAAPDPGRPDPALVARFRDDLTALTGTAGDQRIGIALSGGPDSCALLLLAAATAPGRTFAMTVDHGLRVEAGDEAAAAAALCAVIAVPHETVRVTVTHDGRGVQAAARTARYAALADWAARKRLDAVLTAHHADDQAETLLMRLARGSGLAGLAGVRAARPLTETTALLRPLLGWRKSELEAIVTAAGVVPARDPSNDDPHYDRTAARRLLAETPWIDSRRVAAAAAHLAEAEAALETIADRHAATALGTAGDEATLRPTAIAEIDRRLLRRLFRERFAKSPDGPAVERALIALMRGEIVTLAEIIGRPRDGLWHFRPAPPRQRSKPSI